MKPTRQKMTTNLSDMCQSVKMTVDSLLPSLSSALAQILNGLSYNLN